MDKEKWTGGSTVTPSDKELFNEDELLERLMGDKELARLLLASFIKDMPSRISALRKALERGDASETRSLAHGIKGVAGNMGSHTLQMLAWEMESACTVGALDHVARLFLSLEKQFENLKHRLREAGLVHFRG